MLACPACRGTLTENTQGGLVCGPCGITFPALGDVLWMWERPGDALLDWRNRFNRRLSELTQEEERLSASRTQQNAKVVEYIDGLERHSAELRSLLAPLKVPESIAPEVHLALKTQLPDHHGLDSYNQNVFRDWCWGAAENQQVSDHLTGTLTNLDLQGKTILVLGSGAGRLALDLHQNVNPEHTFTLDSNPLLCLLASQMYQGNSLMFTEFPRNPNGALAIEQRLSSGTTCDDITVLCGDALHPPIQPGSIDLLITPWFIDIVDAEFSTQLAVYASLLREGGLWLNHGSLAFNKQDVSQRLDGDDVRTQTASAGFDVLNIAHQPLPYLASPHERQQRTELTFTQLARRNNSPIEVPAQKEHLPDWLNDAKLTVPLSDEFQTQITTTRVHGFIMSLINGARSIQDMAAVLEEQRLMPKNEAVQAISQLLRVMHNERLAQQRER